MSRFARPRVIAVVFSGLRPGASPAATVIEEGSGARKAADTIAALAPDAIVQQYRTRLYDAPTRANAREFVLRTLEQNPGARVILYGHSRGGYSAVALATDLKAHGVQVDVLITADAAMGWRSDIMPTITPANVGVHLNYFQRNPGAPADPARGRWEDDAVEAIVRSHGVPFTAASPNTRVLNMEDQFATHREVDDIANPDMRRRLESFLASGESGRDWAGGTPVDDKPQETPVDANMTDFDGSAVHEHALEAAAVAEGLAEVPDSSMSTDATSDSEALQSQDEASVPNAPDQDDEPFMSSSEPSTDDTSSEADDLQSVDPDAPVDHAEPEVSFSDAGFDPSRSFDDSVQDRQSMDASSDRDDVDAPADEADANPDDVDGDVAGLDGDDVSGYTGNDDGAGFTGVQADFDPSGSTSSPEPSATNDEGHQTTESPVRASTDREDNFSTAPTPSDHAVTVGYTGNDNSAGYTAVTPTATTTSESPADS